MAQANDAALLKTVRRFVALAAPDGRRDDCWTEALLTHPKYPNAPAVVDAVRHAGVQSAAVRAGIPDLQQLSLPSLLHLHGGAFAVLEELQGDRLLWTHPKAGRQWVSTEHVRSVWSGIALIVDAVTQPAKDCPTRPRIDARAIAIAAALALLVVLFVFGKTAPTAAYALLLLHAAGAVLSLAMGARDENSRLRNALCPAGSVFDCTRVLDSRVSSIAGVPLTDWAAAYFLGGAIAFASAIPTGTALLPLWGWIAALTLPIVAASVFAQAFTVRAWCAGCLMIDLLLVLAAVIAWSYRGAVTQPALATAAVGLFVAVLLLAMRSIEPASQTDQRRRYLRLRRDPAVVAGLLAYSRPVALQPLPSSIVVGAAGAIPALTLITSPYCPACADAHADLHVLTSNSGTAARMLFLCDPEQQNIGTRAVITAVALEAGNRAPEAIALIEQWFAAVRSRRELDASRVDALYSDLPSAAIAAAKASLQEQQQAIFGAGIDATPAVLLYGRRLPDHYAIGDLHDVDLAAVARLMSPPAAPERSASQ